MALLIRRLVAAVVALSLAVGLAVADLRTVVAPSATRFSEDPIAETDLGPMDPSKELAFSVVIRPPDPAELEAFLAGLHDPSSPDYGQFMTAAAYGQRFGATDDQVARLTTWLEARGFDVEPPPAQRTALNVRATVDLVNQTFDVSMRNRLDEQGRAYSAPDREPRVPKAIAGLVSAVAALTDRPPDYLTPTLHAVPHGVLLPGDVTRAYEIDELHAAGFHGEGQSIGIVSFDTFNDQDVGEFDRVTETATRGGGDPPDVRRVRLRGAATEPGDGSGEVNLDIDVIRAVAPMAQIINYESPNAAFGPVIRRIVDDGDVDIVSISWGLCERKLSKSDQVGDDAEFAAAAAVGISIFVASGDHGAHDCRFWPVPRNNPRFRDLDVSLTAPGSPAVILVGGTYLTVTTDGSYYGEAGWEDALTGWGTGGGLSTLYPRPSWQQGVGVDNQFSNGRRQGPDVAGPADSDSGFLVVYTPPGDNEYAYVPLGGTSAAAPFWAGSMLLARQLAASQGVDAPGFGQLGQLGPLLYELSAGSEPGALFHDVVRGGNLLHNATPGWDYATGLGSPRVGPLARAIVDRLR
jgi:kumamolisin